jgi:hypothetical protein
LQQWAEVRRLHFVRGLSIREIHRRTGLHRETIGNALESDDAPRYSRAPAGSKLDPFRDEIHRLLREDPKLPGQRVRELIAQLGFDGGKTIVDDYLREVRPLFAPPPRTFPADGLSPGEVCQFDLWEPRAQVPVGHGQDAPRLGRRRLPGLLASRRGRADLLPSRRRICWPGWRAVCGRSAALPETLVWDRHGPAATGPAPRARSSRRSAAD